MLKPDAQPFDSQCIPDLLHCCGNRQVFQKESRWVHGSYSLKLICFGIVLPVHAHQELTLRVDKECLSDSLLFLIRALICLRSSLVNLL